jgi:uncharacterized protein YjeT (DUF2065 family)
LDSDLLWSALALMLVLEGLFPFLSPNGWRQTFLKLLQLRDGQLRFFVHPDRRVAAVLPALMANDLAAAQRGSHGFASGRRRQGHLSSRRAAPRSSAQRVIRPGRAGPVESRF